MCLILKIGYSENDQEYQLKLIKRGLVECEFIITVASKWYFYVQDVYRKILSFNRLGNYHQSLLVNLSSSHHDEGLSE